MPTGHLALTLDEGEGRIFVDQPIAAFASRADDLPCGSWDPRLEGWTAPLHAPLPTPGCATVPSPLLEAVAGGYAMHYDVFGLTYWLLSRQEEVNCTAFDSHGRFPATASHAFRHGYLERPVVDEWLDVLGQVMARLWPQLQRRARVFAMKLSHDVDLPSRYAFRPTRGWVGAIGEDILRHRRLADALRAPAILLGGRRRLHRADPWNTFDWLMTVSERHSVASAFYFICGRTSIDLDAGYEPDDEVIRNLMRTIHLRGHEIGLHPSYNTYLRPDLIEHEALRLKQVCASERIVQTAWGGRMHYLRWRTPTTLQGWEQAGMTYDSSLGYADRAGFRCGTCLEYPAFDPVAQRQLRLRIRPLVAMDGAVMAKQYMGLGTGDAALSAFVSLKSACKAVGGTFTLLWHNSELNLPEQRALYQSVLAH
jgi:hypothetical protein